MFAQEDSPGTDQAKIHLRWQTVIRQWLAPATELMLELVQIQPGGRILDISAGDADLPLQAARIAGPGGRVVTINRRENGLVLAARTAVQMGSASLETVVMDGEMLAFAGQSFDGVLCQFGGMPFSDVPDSLQQLFRVLKPAGKACVIALTQPERNEFVSIPLAIIRSHIPPGLLSGQTDLFRLGGRGVLEAFLARAGFRQVETHIISAPLRLPSAAECVHFERDTFAVFYTLLAGLDEPVREETWRKIEAGLAHLDGAGGFTASCELIVGMGSKCG